MKPLLRKTPHKALNKAFLKIKPNRASIECFKKNLIALLDNINTKEHEEHNKNLISDFLKKTYYDSTNFINTKGRNDLVIHNGNTAKSSVGVIIEAKSPAKKMEMVSNSKLNAKSFQELVLYFLRERISQKNFEIKHLIVTNVYEWFIFDAGIFEKYFSHNKNLVKEFEDFEAGRLSGNTTDLFYKEIAEPCIAEIEHNLEYTYFDLRDYTEPLRNEDKQDDNKLISLYKLLSPEHLLKLPFVNDSNTLDKGFYSELLHIIGLRETKVDGKKLIERLDSKDRNTGTIIEDAIIQLDSLDKLSRLQNINQYGTTHQERLFNIGLELSITWINRILFLKLLEAQLITYNKDAVNYSFLNIKKIQNYDALNSLFFQVLAKKHSERNSDVKSAFDKVPYLNSSLFEPTELEHSTVLISNLRDDKQIPVSSSTILKDQQGKKRAGKMTSLEYLFEFLNAYDFTSEGSEEIQEENKSLINASVLGLIFEKINGYKDGSFFTPGFITMYMCRESIRRAVIQKFNEKKKWKCTTIDELYDKIEDRKEANKIVNDIKICDPAVGSGHFLVSALNEIIAVKHDLKILQDRDGKRLKEYSFEVVNDELLVTDEDGKFFEYNPANKESQRIQETLFHEKQTIIENCLFGVDINTNSVKICRLRLWIELLKNAYYKNKTELETLPNIDINIKCGNSLVSRFSIDADLGQALKKSKWNIDSYKLAVATYRDAQSKEQKREMEKLISDIKGDFRSEIEKNDSLTIRLYKLNGDLFKITNQTVIFEQTQKEKDAWNLQVQKLTKDIQAVEKTIEGVKNNKIYENAFEWRFEFPEVLNNDGDFNGFDLVIGNPPYFILTKNNTESVLLSHYLNEFETIKSANSKNIFNLFIELGITIGNKNAIQSMIVPEGLFETRSYSETLKLFGTAGSIINITRIEGMVFDEANTGNVIFILHKGKNEETTEMIFDKNHYLSLHYKKLNAIVSKIEKGNFLKLSEICNLFKGMVVDKRKDFIHLEPNKKLENKFLLGNCISKWKIDNYYYCCYDQLKIIGGTKVKEKHDIAPRIIIRRTGDKLCCAYLKQPALTESTLYSCWSVNDKIDNLYVLGIFHSKVADYYIKNKLITNKQAFPQILMTDLQSFPIPQPTLTVQKTIVDIVSKILGSSQDTTDLEKRIDKLVYELYGLTEDEIKIVEGAES
jgi:chaperonin cofactor prefoldin